MVLSTILSWKISKTISHDLAFQCKVYDMMFPLIWPSFHLWEKVLLTFHPSLQASLSIPLDYRLPPTPLLFSAWKEMRNFILKVEMQWDFLFVPHRQWPFENRRPVATFLVINCRLYNQTNYLGEGRITGCLPSFLSFGPTCLVERASSYQGSFLHCSQSFRNRHRVCVLFYTVFRCQR